MANTSAAPYQAPCMLSKKIKPVLVDGIEHLQVHGSYPAIDADSNSSWQLVQPLLAGINLLNDRNCHQGGFTKPARIEMFMSSDSLRTRGLVIYDETGRLIVHVVNALLGYSGAGPQLSKQILTFMDVSPGIIGEIQAAASQEKGPKTYNIILTRNRYGWHWRHGR